MPVEVVVGGQWGDEGKGKVVDLLAQDADLVIRAQGGANAGHTVINELGTFALNQVPSGIFNPKARVHSGAGTAYNVALAMQELSHLESRGVSTANYTVSEKAWVTLALHCAIDGLQEDAKGDGKIGTTKKGIGPTYTGKVERNGLRMWMLRDPDVFMGEVTRYINDWTRDHSFECTGDEFRPDFYEDLAKEATRFYSGRIVNGNGLVQDHLRQDKKIVVEGAQGTLLDVDHGNSPYVTSSNTVVAGLLIGAEVPPSALTCSTGVFKAYSTRVGGGCLPTNRELDEQSERIAEKAQEFGVVTRRKRRVGPFDLVAAAYSQDINGFHQVVLTRLDILSGMGDLRVCVSYNTPQGETTEYPTIESKLAQCEPNYVTLPGWNEDLSDIRHYNDLPANAKLYVLSIQEGFARSALTPRLKYIGVGPRREQMIAV